MANLILLGGGAEGLPIIQKAKLMGHRIVVIDANPYAPGFSWADRCAVASCYHSDAAIKELKLIGERYDGVMCSAIDAPHVAAAIREEFGLPGLSVASARLSVDKGDQKAVLRAFGVPVPDSTGRNPIKPSIQSDWVIKPVDSRGGRGVIRLGPNVDYEWAYKTARALSPTGQVVIERWLDGEQYSTESIILGGKIVFTACGLRNYDRLAEFAPFCLEDGFDVLSLPPCGIDAVNELIARACAALGWLDCAPGLTVKGDLIWHDGGLVVLELAARLSGGYFCSHVTPMAYGIDFVYAAIKLALGEGLEESVIVNTISGKGAGFVSQRYVFPDIFDIGRRVVSLPRVPGWAAWATWLIKPGDIIKPVTSHAARLGQACCVAGTLADAENMARTAVERDMKAGVVLE